MNQPKTSTLATVALVLSVLCPPIGFILGIIAFVRINGSNGQLGGKNVAIVAMVLPAGMVPIVGILAAIAIPNFIRFQLRAKTSEAKATLGAIRTTQEAFKEDRGGYFGASATPSSPPSGKKAAWEERVCPESCGPTNPAACTEFSCAKFNPESDVYYRYACTAKEASGSSPPEFTCVAVGDVDGDGAIAVFVYGSGNALGATTIQAPLPALAGQACTGEILANQVIECTHGEF